MKAWKSKLVPALWALGGVLSLIPAVVGPVIEGEPLNNVFLGVAFVFFAFAIVFFAAGRRSSGGPPSA